PPQKLKEMPQLVNGVDAGCPLERNEEACASRFGGSIDGCHWALPRRRPQASRQASARTKPSATHVKAPASRSAAIVSSCLSLTRPLSVFSSRQNSLPL